MHLRYLLHVRRSIIAILLSRFLDSARQPVAEVQARRLAEVIRAEVLPGARAATSPPHSGHGRRHNLQPAAETTPQNTATARIAQINNMILQHVIAIDIDPASPVAR
jgi:hypothetical protein